MYFQPHSFLNCFIEVLSHCALITNSYMALYTLKVGKNSPTFCLEASNILTCDTSNIQSLKGE